MMAPHCSAPSPDATAPPSPVFIELDGQPRPIEAVSLRPELRDPMHPHGANPKP